MKTFLKFPLRRVIFLCALITVAGCGKSKTASTESNPPPTASLDEADKTPANVVVPVDSAMPPTASRPKVAPVTIPPPDADASATLGQLTQLLHKFSVENRRVPKTLGELVSAGYLTAIPVAPAGKTFAIDPKRLEVVLSNR